MKPIKTITIGSNAFFKSFSDFSPKDVDELNIMDTFPLMGNSIQFRGLHGKDVFFFKNMSKEEFITDTLNSKLPMVVGKFLVPEFAEYIGLTINDLKKLETVFNRIDDLHKYEICIYNYYVKNNGFYLTQEQLETVFNEYKKERTK